MKNKTFATEAGLEAEIHGALGLAFPWLPEGAIEHQTTFSVFFGTKAVKVDALGTRAPRVRADILLRWNGDPLAILELKRPGSRLSAEDEAQGLSYARLLTPQAPLVVVTNGVDCRLIETRTAQPWLPDEAPETAFADLVKSASLASTHDLKRAISTLMGSNPEVWVQALRQTSEENIAELSSDWRNSLAPFVPDFLIPRKATQEALEKFKEHWRLVLIEGPPLIGKSNVLRELHHLCSVSEDQSVLYISADSGRGIYQQIADTLSQALSWRISPNDARHWLIDLSNSVGHTLILAIDSTGLGLQRFIDHVEDISSNSFGQSLRLAVALDDTVSDRLVLSFTGRSASAIGRRATRISVGPLDDDEFTDAARILQERRATIIKGGEFATEFRLPWVLRAVMSEIVSQPEYENDSLLATFPPFLGLNLLAHARTLIHDDESRRRIRGVAQAFVQEVQDQSRPISLILTSLKSFVVRRKALEKYLVRADIDVLMEQGYLRSVLHDQTIPSLVVRTPELLAAETATVLAAELSQRASEDPTDAAEWISGAAGRIPMGDVIAAQAVVDVAMQDGRLPLGLIEGLANSEPRQESIAPGTRMAMHWPGSGVMNLTFGEGGTLEVEAHGHRQMIQPESGEKEESAYSEFHSWLILSHLAGMPFALETRGGRRERVDPEVLRLVGKCPMVLRRPDADTKVRGILVHEVPDQGSLASHENGIVEPITLSILNFLSNEGENAQSWIEEVATDGSLPLLVRVDIALRFLTEVADRNKVELAQRMLDNILRPAMANCPDLH